MGQVETASSFAGNFRWLQGPSRATVVLLLAVATMSLPVLVPWVAPHDSRLFMYPYGAALFVLTTSLCVRAARNRSGVERVAWIFLAAHMVLLGAGMGIASVQAWTGYPQAREGSWLINAAGACGAVCCLFALTAGETGRMKRTLDAVMSFLLGVLIFLAVSSTKPTGFSEYHHQTLVAVACFLLLCAFAAQQAAETPERERFTSIVATYLLCRIAMLFLVNIVGVTWLHEPHEMPFNILFGLGPIGFCVAALSSTWRLRLWRPVLQSVIARTALPAAVLIAAVVLGICLSTQYRWLTGFAILLCVLCFVMRTQLLYEALFDQQNTLRSQASTLEQWALLDHLTGIGNRRFLEQRAEEILSAADCQAAILLLDTDYFKEINDTLGHAEGDNLLQNIANMLKQEIEDTDEGICARMGGDEFAVLLPSADATKAMSIAQGLRMSFVSLPLYEELHPTVSIGVAVADGPTTLTMLLGHADSALYQSKEKGRDRVELAQYPA